jgi:hypothetical protein
MDVLGFMRMCITNWFVVTLDLTGNLSSHLARLEEAGLVLIEKRFMGKTPNTLVSLTEQGQTAIERHWQLLEKLRTVRMPENF